MNQFKFQIGQKVKTPTLGQGTVTTTTNRPYDGNCYTLQLDSGKTQEFRESALTSTVSPTSQISHLAQLLADRFNLDLTEVETVVRQVL